jgi:hypothetical protein
MTRACLALLLSAICSAAVAGGTSVPVQILGLVRTASDEYLLTYKTLDGPEYEFEELPRNRVLTVHLRFSRLRYLTKGDFLTLAKYRKAVAMLKDQVTGEQTVRFGRMGGGLCPIKGKTNEFDSDALDIYEEEVGPTKMKQAVVYSFCKYS